MSASKSRNCFRAAHTIGGLLTLLIIVDKAFHHLLNFKKESLSQTFYLGQCIIENNTIEALID